jgi:hypothetical protein
VTKHPKFEAAMQTFDYYLDKDTNAILDIKDFDCKIFTAVVEDEGGTGGGGWHVEARGDGVALSNLQEELAAIQYEP